MRRLTIIALSGIAFVATAQSADEEYMRKLREFQERTATNKTDPAPARAARTGWTLKPGAPKCVVDWFDSIPEMKRRYVRVLTQLIEEGERQRGRRTPKQAAALESMRQVAREVGADDYFITFPPPLRYRNDEYGTLENPSILQVVDESNCLVVKGDRVFWLSGVITAGHVDGEHLTPLVVVIVGTKQYVRADGTTNTVFLLEPVPLDDYLDNWPTRPGSRDGYIPRRPPPPPALPPSTERPAEPKAPPPANAVPPRRPVELQKA